MQRVETRFVTLVDGRRLAYVELGDPGGWPVVNCHGGLIGRLDVVSAAEDARDLGIRLLSPDRPGIGYSDPKSGRTTRDWAADVAGLADAVGIERFSVHGWSIGGQYALACAAVLGARVARVAFVAGAIPLDETDALAELNHADRALASLAGRAPRFAAGVFAASGHLARWAPTIMTTSTARVLAASDREAIRGMGRGAYATAIADAQRQPRGMVEETPGVAVGLPAPGHRDAGRRLVRGNKDRLVPSSLVRAARAAAAARRAARRGQRRALRRLRPLAAGPLPVRPARSPTVGRRTD